MKLSCYVDQKSAIARGYDSHSTVCLDVNPAELTPSQREELAKYFYEGRWPVISSQPAWFALKEPTRAGLLERLDLLSKEASASRQEEEKKKEDGLRRAEKFMREFISIPEGDLLRDIPEEVLDDGTVSPGYVGVNTKIAKYLWDNENNARAVTTLTAPETDAFWRMVGNFRECERVGREAAAARQKARSEAEIRASEIRRATHRDGVVELLVSLGKNKEIVQRLAEKSVTAVEVEIRNTVICLLKMVCTDIPGVSVPEAGGSADPDDGEHEINFDCPSLTRIEAEVRLESLISSTLPDSLKKLLQSTSATLTVRVGALVDQQGECDFAKVDFVITSPAHIESSIELDLTSF